LSELAFNYKGERFTPPSEATYWRVRRFRDGQRGALDVYLDPAGLPLIVRIDIGIDQFREAVRDQPGRYRLDALNAEKMALAGVDPAYVTVPSTVSVAVADGQDELELEPDFDHAGMHVLAPRVASRALRNGVGGNAATVTAPYGTWPALPTPTAMSGVEYVLAEAVRSQVQVNKQQGDAHKQQSDAHTQQLGQFTAMVTTTLNAIPPLLAATNARAERMETLVVELLLRHHGITPPPPPPAPPPPPPAPVAPPPAAPPPPAVFYAMPRNAFVADDAPIDDAGDDAHDDERTDDDDASDDAATEAQGEDFFTKATKLVVSVGQAVAPVAEVAKMVMGAGFGGLGSLLGGGDSPRNAAPTAPAELASDEPEVADPMAHLRVSHVLAVSYELGPKDGSIFRRLLRAMEREDRAMFTERLCAMPLDEAVRFAAKQVEWLKGRMARSHAPCDTPTDVEDDADATPDEPANENTAYDDANDDANDDDAYDDEAGAADDNLADVVPEPDTHTEHGEDTTQNDPSQDDDDDEDDSDHSDHSDHSGANMPAPPAREPTIDHASTSVATVPEASRTPSPMPEASRLVPEVPRPLTPDVVEHMKLITKHLRFPEILQAQALINNTSITERNGWIARLMALAPAEAAAVVCAELARRAGQ
jgi:hypothetical protein